MEKIAGVKIVNLKKTYEVSGRLHPVLQGLSVELDDSQITVVLGKSGCGKTTLLRVISGLEEKEEGQIIFEQQKKLGILFQEPRLMPWLTVRQNLLFGVPKREQKKEVKKREVENLLSLTGLTDFKDAYPHQLSGGMMQRTALARALAYEASYLLMDEPFAALDYFTRQTMQKELLHIREAKKTGVLFVTHSIDEALILGDRILVMEQGKIGAAYDMTAVKNKANSFSELLLIPEMTAIKKEIEERLQGGNVQ